MTLCLSRSWISSQIVWVAVVVTAARDTRTGTKGSGGGESQIMTLGGTTATAVVSKYLQTTIN